MLKILHHISRHEYPWWMIETARDLVEMATLLCRQSAFFEVARLHRQIPEYSNTFMSEGYIIAS